MRRVRALAAAAAALVATGLTVADPASADATVRDVGWWTKRPAAQAPQGGFVVGIGPDGAPVSVAAIRVMVDTELDSAVLVLAEDGDGIQEESAQLRVCVTPNAWKPGAAQAYGDAPKPECDRGSAPLSRDTASTTWTADVAPLLAGAAGRAEGASLMVVPAGQAAVPVAFEVRFRAPVLEAAAATSPPPPPPEGGPATGVSSPGSGKSGPEPSAFPDIVQGTVATAAPAAPPTADGAAGASLAPTAEGVTEVFDASTGGEAALPARSAAAPSTATGNRALQAIVFLLLSTVAGVAAGVGRWLLRRRTADGAFLA